MSASADITPTSELRSTFSLHVIGVGGAGGNAVDHMSRTGLDGVRFFALNTDARALVACGADDKLVMGSRLNRGLGTGGDPDMGRAAAEQDLERIKGFCNGADIVFIVAGLGGGTGTGASPVVARAAREAGALVLAMVTLPFEFEGGRRQRQALNGLQALKAEADAVICLPNQKLFKMIDEHTNVVDTFNISNELLGQGVAGVWRLLTRTGLINVDFADLCAVTRGRHSESCFAAAEADGDNRSSQVMEKLLTHPLLDGGQMLSESSAVLVSLVGGPDLTMNEVNRIMEQINRHCENAHLIMGAAIDEALLGRVRVTLVASCGADREVPDGTRPRAGGGRVAGQGLTENSVRPLPEHDTQFLDKAETSRPPSRFVPPAPDLSDGKKMEMFKRQSDGRSRRKAANMKQGQLDLEIVSKGRFEKSEPTIHHGEDLDVPTYIRRGVPLN